MNQINEFFEFFPLGFQQETRFLVSASNVDVYHLGRLAKHEQHTPSVSRDYRVSATLVLLGR
jgi:hypothetical protein